MIKLLILGRGRRGMPVDEQRSYMKDVHGAAVVRLIAEEPDLAPRRYVQNHVTASIAAGGAAPDARDFVTQVWFDDQAQMEAALTTPRYVDDLHHDEDNFVDQSSVTVLPVAATVAREADPAATAKVFVLSVSAAPAEEVLAGADGVVGLVRNQVLRPDAPYAAVDEVWFGTTTQAASAVQTWLDDGILPPSVSLLADEHVLHDGPAA